MQMSAVEVVHELNNYLEPAHQVHLRSRSQADPPHAALQELVRISALAFSKNGLR